MEVTTTISTEGLNMRFSGHVRTFDESARVRVALDNFVCEHPGKAIVLYLPDAHTMTSSVVGTLLRLVQKEKVPLSVRVGTEELWALLSRLQMIEIFKAQRIGA